MFDCGIWLWMAVLDQENLKDLEEGLPYPLGHLNLVNNTINDLL